MPLQEVNDHFYTISDEKRRGAMNKYDYSDEGNEGWVLPAQRAGTTPLWRLWSEAGTNHFYTISDEQRDGAIKKYGYRLEGHEGFVFRDQPRRGTGPLYRLWNEQTSDHFYTVHSASRQGAIEKFGFSDEGHEGFVFLNPTRGATPLYRLYLGEIEQPQYWPFCFYRYDPSFPGGLPSANQARFNQSFYGTQDEAWAQAREFAASNGYFVHFGACPPT
jgi:hypothetical protein